MKLIEFIKIVDPEMEGLAWLTFKNDYHEIQAKANTCSSFLKPIYEREIVYVRAADKDEFDIYLVGDL